MSYIYTYTTQGQHKPTKQNSENGPQGQKWSIVFCGLCWHCVMTFAGSHPSILVARQELRVWGKKKRTFWAPQVRNHRLMTDSTIDPPEKTAIFFIERFMAARHDERCYKKYYLHVFPCLQRAPSSGDRGGG